jgi:hypothetical protein
MVRRQRRRSLVFQPEQLLETVDLRVDLFVGERVFGHAIPLQERIGLETVEAKDLPEIQSQIIPPLARIFWPVIQRASSLTSKATTSAMSAG